MPQAYTIHDDRALSLAHERPKMARKENHVSGGIVITKNFSRRQVLSAVGALSLAVVLSPVAVSATTKAPVQTTGKTLVVYYSRTGHTQHLAKLAATTLHAPLFALDVVEPYPPTYSELVQLIPEEQRAEKVRALKAMPDLTGVTTIILGTPLWWSQVSGPVFSFLKTAKLAGITVKPFAVSHRSPADRLFAEVNTLKLG